MFLVLTKLEPLVLDADLMAKSLVLVLSLKVQFLRYKKFYLIINRKTETISNIEHFQWHFENFYYIQDFISKILF